MNSTKKPKGYTTTKVKYLQTMVKIMQGRYLNCQSLQDAISNVFNLNNDTDRCEINLIKRNKDLHDSVNTVLLTKAISELAHLKELVKERVENEDEMSESVVSLQTLIENYNKGLIQMQNVLESKNEYEYISLLHNYRTMLTEKRMEEKKSVVVTPQLKLRKRKLEQYLKKVNCTRMIKLQLMASSGKKLKPELHEYASGLKRNLTLEDFESSWNIGYRVNK